MENGRNKGKVYRYLLISFVYLHDCKLVFILLSVTTGSFFGIHGGISEGYPYLEEGTSVSSETQSCYSSPPVLAATSHYNFPLAKNMSATVAKREMVQHFTVNTEATSAVSSVRQPSVCPVSQMQSFGEITQTQTIESILAMLAPSDQYMLDKLIHDVGGEATGEQTLPPTGTSPIPSTTFASSVGDFDASPSQSDGVSGTIMPQVSTGNSLPESLREAGKELKPLAFS